MEQKLIQVRKVTFIRRPPEWPKFRYIGGELQRIMSEDSPPEYLYKDELVTEWREIEC